MVGFGRDGKKKRIKSNLITFLIFLLTRNYSKLYGELNSLKRRVVITGQGAVSALGMNAEENCNSLQEGVCGISELSLRDLERLSVRVGAEIKNYRQEDYFNRQELSYYDKFTQFALLAAEEALESSGIDISEEVSERFGVILGNAGGGLRTQDENFRNVYELKKNRVHPFIVPKLMNSAASSQLSIKFNAKGASYTVSSACASSNHAMGQAFHLIRSGSLSMALTGGSESMLSFGGIKAWEGLRVMSPDVCRPFSANRNGMVQGEGAAIFVFEEYEQAKMRGANILAEVAGFAMTSDASDIIKPSRFGAKNTMLSALKDAEINEEEIGYINAHGTGTLLNDRIEGMAIRETFADHTENLLISSSKSMHGHLIGGTGAIELLSCLMAVNQGVVTPTINYQEVDSSCQINLVANQSVERRVNFALSNSFAFGGMNAVLVLKKFC